MSASAGTRTMVDEEQSPSVYNTTTPASRSANDLQEYLRQSTTENGEPTERLSSLTRADSIFSFSKSSMSSQLSGLTSMTLPQAESLAASVAAIPTAPKAVKQLTASAAEIQKWTQKAIKVLGNLDADDDVEWAAAAGRDALDDVDTAVNKFERLIEVYVQAIEELQMRSDVSDIDGGDLTAVVEQMETTLKDWDLVRKLLKEVHEQVELAMEWEELWGVVLGDVGNELESLEHLVFEMEERRHKAMRADAENKPTAGIDLDELETIVEETPSAPKTPANYRYSLPPALTAAPASPVAQNPEDDKNLLALFARMQPLRASLDFLPMRLSMFQSRAEKIFPSACAELEEKRIRLEKSWKQLEKEAETLRRELGEDRWILVFRNAGRQATKMIESVERSVAKLREALDTGVHHSNPPALAKKVESFEAKRVHYGPAIDRVLLIIQKGVKDRLTVNGEILRLHLDLTERVEILHQQMDAMQAALEDVNSERDSQIRDSISTLISMDRSMSGSFIETPGSSPASSVILAPGDTSTPHLNGSKVRASSRSRPSTTKRYSSLPQPRRLSSSLLSPMNGRTASPSPAPTTRSSVTPTPVRRPAPNPVSDKPRWNSSTNTNDLMIGHNFKTLSATTSSPYRRIPPPRSASRTSSIPIRSPLSREASSSPVPGPSTNGRMMRPPSRTSNTGSSFAERVASGSMSNRSPLLDPVPYSKVTRNSSAPNTHTITSPSSKATGINKPLPSTPPSMRPAPTIRPPSSLRSRTSASGLPYRPSRAETPSIPEDSSPILPPSTTTNRDLEDIPSSPPQSSPTPALNSSPPLPPPTKTARKRASMLPLPSSPALHTLNSAISSHGRTVSSSAVPGNLTKRASSSLGGKMGGNGRVSSLGQRPAWK